MRTHQRTMRKTCGVNKILERCMVNSLLSWYVIHAVNKRLFKIIQVDMVTDMIRGSPCKKWKDAVTEL